MSQHKAVLLLGSNLADPERNIHTAINFIKNEIGEIEKQSELLFTKPVEFASNNIFCNIAVLINTHFSPIELLNSIKEIEQKMGRETDTVVSKIYTDRIIDIDIVLFDNLHFIAKRLQIPHQKHLHQREFSQMLLNRLEKD